MRGNVVVQHVVYIRRVNNNTLYPCSQADDVAGNVIDLLRNIPDPYKDTTEFSKFVVYNVNMFFPHHIFIHYNAKIFCAFYSVNCLSSKINMIKKRLICRLYVLLSVKYSEICFRIIDS